MESNQTRLDLADIIENSQPNIESPDLEASFRPALFPKIDSCTSSNSQDSLQRYLAERSEEDNLRAGFTTFLDYSRVDSSSKRGEVPPTKKPQKTSLQAELQRQSAEIERMRRSLQEAQKEKDAVVKHKQNIHAKYSKYKHKSRSLLKELNKLTAAKQSQEADFREILNASETDRARLKVLEEELQTARQEIQRLEEHTLIQERPVLRVKDLEEQIENLTLELESRPTHKMYREAVSRLKEAEAQATSRSRSSSCNRSNVTIIQNNETRQRMRKDRELHNLPRGDTPSEGTLKVLAKELMELLKVENVVDVLPAVKELYRPTLFDKVSALLKEYTGMKTEPNATHAWKWVKRLAEEHLMFKRMHSSQLLGYLKDKFGVSNHEQIPGAVNEMIKQAWQSERLLSDLKKFLKVSPETSIKELDKLLNKDY